MMNNRLAICATLVGFILPSSTAFMPRSSCANFWSRQNPIRCRAGCGPVVSMATESRRPAPAPQLPRSISITRRAGLNAVLSIASVAGLSRPSVAFDNAIADYAKYADKPKRRGTPPKDLGVSKRTINADSSDADERTFDGLRGCDGKPRCFSSTGDDLLEDRILTGVDTLIQPWKPPSGDATPIKSVAKALSLYQPGQGNIDGGGFQVIKQSDTYLYVQFEALKKGYIDDVEFFLGTGGVVQVRSSSRVGQTDFAVNAKRLNYLAAELRAVDGGWAINDITPKTHPDYFEQARDALDQTFDADRRKGTDFENERMERPTIG